MMILGPEHVSEEQQKKRLRSLSALASASQQEAALTREWRLQKVREDEEGQLDVADRALNRYMRNVQCMAEIFGGGALSVNHADDDRLRDACAASIPSSQQREVDDEVRGKVYDDEVVAWEMTRLFARQKGSQEERAKKMKLAMEASMRKSCTGDSDEEEGVDVWKLPRFGQRYDPRRVKSEKAQEAVRRIDATGRLSKLADKVHDRESLSAFSEAYENAIGTPFLPRSDLFEMGGDAGGRSAGEKRDDLGTGQGASLEGLVVSTPFCREVVPNEELLRRMRKWSASGKRNSKVVKLRVDPEGKLGPDIAE